MKRVGILALLTLVNVVVFGERLVMLGQSSADDVRKLSFGKSIERNIETGDLHQYKVTLRQGQVFFVELDEQTFDVKLVLVRTADGRTVASMNLGDGLDRENLIFVAEESGDYLLRMDAAENQFGNGSYRFSTRLADALSEKDKIRIEALQLMSEAFASQKENTALKIREAISKREQALTLWRQIGDKYWEGRTLDRLGTAHNALQENNKAIDYVNRALQIVKDSGDKALEAATLNTIGSMINGFGENQQAIDYHNQALHIFEKRKNHVGMMISLQFLGNAYVGKKDYPNATDSYQKSLALAQKDKNRNFEAAGLYLLGTVLEAQNEKPKALGNHEQALALWREIGNRRGIALSLFNIGTIRDSQGDTAKALEDLTEALRLSKLEKSRGLDSSIHFALSTLYSRLHKGAEAVEETRELLAYHQEFKLSVFETITACTLALQYENLPNFKEAIKYAEMSLATAGTAPEKTVETRKKSLEDAVENSKANALMTLARIYFNSGDTEKALHYDYQVLAAFENKDDKESKQRSLNVLASIAQIHRFKYEWSKAQDDFNRALVIAKALDNKVQIGLLLNSIGLVYDATGERRRASDYFEESQKILSVLPNKGDQERRLEASVLANIGQGYLFLGESAKALEYHNRSLAIWQEIKDPSFIDGQSLAYGNIADVYSFRGENEKAIELLNRSLELFRQAPLALRGLARNRSTESTLLNNLGIRYKETGRLRKALEYYDQALKMAVETGRVDMEATTLNNIALLNLAFGEPQKALQNLNRAWEIGQKIGDKAGEPTVLNNIAQVHSYWGNQQQVLDYTKRALAAAEELGNKQAIATCLNNIGNAYQMLGDNDRAFESLSRSLKISQDIGDKSGQVSALSNLAYLYSSTGERGKALAGYEQSLTLAREIGNKTAEATVLGNIGFDYAELGENQKALGQRRQALEINREIGDKGGELTQLVGIGSIYRKMGEQAKNPEDLREALVNYELAKNISRETESKVGEAVALHGIGQTYVALNDPAKAGPALTEALAYSIKYQNRFLQDAVHYALGRLSEKAREFDKAIAEYQQALTVARSIADKDIEAKALNGLMSAWKARGDDQAAIFYGKQAVNRYQELRGAIRNLKRESQDVFRDKVTATYRDLANLLIGQGRLPEAEQILGLLKEAEFRQLQVSRGGESPDTIPYSKAEASVLSAVESLSSLENERTDLLKQDESPAVLSHLDQITQKIKAANLAFLTALSALKGTEKSVDERIGKIEEQRNLEGLLQELEKQEGTGLVALYTVLGTEPRKKTNDNTEASKAKFGWIILVHAGNPAWRKAYPIDVTNLEQLVQQFRQALGSDRYDPQPLAEKIYNAIFRQTSNKQKTTLEADLATVLGRYRSKTLMWSLDGVLRYVPMAALHDGKGYLVEKYRNIVFTDSSLINLERHSAPGWTALGLGVSEAKTIELAGGVSLKFLALNGTPRELQDIVHEPQSATGIVDGTIRLNKDFTKDATLRLLRKGTYQVVHIASHYSFNVADQSGSFLLLGDGRLTLAELKPEDNLFGSVDLLTLSACDTAMGGANGEEAEGFAVLAQELGAKSVIASLWKVSDEGTPELMVRFYKLRTENPTMAKGEAFRQAQLQLLGAEATGRRPLPTVRSAELMISSSGQEIRLPLFVRDSQRPFSHPHYWASFILIGNWR